MRRTEYRIITEDLQRDRIIELISGYFSGFSITENTGFWNHGQEKSIVISIIAGSDQKTRLTIKMIGTQIRDINKQDSVLITEHKLKAIFI